MIRHWTARHPEWDDREVTSYRVGSLLVDPLTPPDDVLDGVEAIVLTSPWHERSTRALVARLGLPVYVPAPEEAPIPGRRLYTAGDTLEVGVVAYGGRQPNDLVLWIPGRQAVVIGDTLIDRGDGLAIPVDWLPDGLTRDQLATSLRPLLELPIEHVLPTHGLPMDRAALERALA